MKAIVCRRYGPPGELQLVEIPKPTPKEGEVLVKARATAVNDYDWSMVRGRPHIYRLLFGLFKPRQPIPGMELAGVVEAVGPGVTKFKPGDAVYGDTSEHAFGTFAEYLAVSEQALNHQAEGMSFEEATAIPHASLLAYQGLVEMGNIQPGERVLINGAGGGVGTFALQLAKQYGAEVTGVDAAHKLEQMKALGYDHVLDYRQTDFTRTGEQYDLILDAKTTRSPSAYLRALRPNGRYVTVGGKLGRLLQLALLGGVLRRIHQKHLRVLPLKANKGLEVIGKLYAEGKIKPLIDGPYPLEKAPWAIQYFGEGKHRGKVVITFPEN